MEPHAGNEAALGFDLASNSERLDAIERARDSGRPVATKRIRLVQETGDQFGFLLFMPVYETKSVPATLAERREKLSGLVLGVFRVADIFEVSSQDEDLHRLFDYYAFDDSAEPGEQLLLFSPSDQHAEAVSPASREDLLRGGAITQTYPVADRNWSVVFSAVPGAFGEELRILPLGLAGLGIALTLLLTQYLSFARNRTREVEQLAEERSRELREANEALQSEARTRERAESALRENEAKMRLVFDSMTEGVIGIDMDGRITFHNAAALTLLGYTRDVQFRRKLVHELIHHTRRDGKPYQPEDSPLLQNLRTGRTALVDDELLWRHDGSGFEAEYRTHPIRLDDQVIGTVMTFLDITERKRFQAELERVSEAATLIRRVAVAINDAGSMDEGFQASLDEICVHTGWPIGHAQISADDGTGELVSSRIWHLDDPLRHGLFRQVTEETRFAPDGGTLGGVQSDLGEAFKFDVEGDSRFLRNEVANDIGVKAAFTFPIVAGKTVGAVLEFFSEIRVETDPHTVEAIVQVSALLGRAIERQHAADRINASEEQLAKILDIAPEAVITVDEVGRVQLFNQGAETLFGYAASEVTGQSLDMLLPERVREIHRKHMEDFKTVAQTVAVMGKRREIIGLRKDGTEFPAEAAVSKVEYRGRTTFMVMMYDITGRKEAEAKFTHVQKMEAIGQLTGGIAHDFNNLLMVIDGYARRTLKNLGTDMEVAGRSLEEVLAATERAARLTKQLLVFSRRQVMERRVFKVADAIRDLKGLLAHSVGEWCELKFEVLDKQVRIRNDQSELSQAIVNLAVNARDAMPKGGTITIGVRVINIDEEFTWTHGDMAPGRYVKISVADEGTGIDEKTLQHIFEPFFTTKEQGQGAGLGLAMVYGFAEQSGGAVDVSTELGSGTTFDLYMPVVYMPVSDEADGDHDPSVPEYRGRNETLLLVEDDDRLLELTYETLCDLGYTVFIASNGLEALEVDEGLEDTVDLLVSDVVMPSLGGFELYEMLREKHPDLKAVFMSGYPTRGAGNVQVPEGTPFLQKPVEPNLLARTIRAELDKSAAKRAE